MKMVKIVKLLVLTLMNKYLEGYLLVVQGVPKKVGFTTCNSSSKSHFFWNTS